MVVVAANYRLDVLGWLAMEELQKEDDEDAYGNYGLHDQRFAMQWTQRNIAAFGGDPDMVTIFGESSGGSSVCTLAVSPLATKLFKRAIIQSGPCVGRWAPLNMTYGVDVAKRVMAEHGVSSIEGQRDVHPASAIQWPRR